MDLLELQGIQSERDIQNEKFLPTVGVAYEVDALPTASRGLISIMHLKFDNVLPECAI